MLQAYDALVNWHKHNLQHPGLALVNIMDFLCDREMVIVNASQNVPSEWGLMYNGFHWQKKQISHYFCCMLHFK